MRSSAVGRTISAGRCWPLLAAAAEAVAAAAEAEAAARATTRALACGRLAAIDHQLACRAALGEKLRRDAHRLGQLDRDADREPPDRLTTAAPPNGPPAPFRPGRDYAAHWNRRAYPADL